MSNYELTVQTKPEHVAPEDYSLIAGWPTDAQINSLFEVRKVGSVWVRVYHAGPPYKVESNVPVRYEEETRTVYFTPPDH